MPKTAVRDATQLRLEPGDVPEAGVEDVLTNPHAPTHAEPLPVLPGFGQAPLRPVGALGTRQEIQDELDGMAAAIRCFALKQPDQVLRECATYSARLTELAVLLHRVENQDRQYTRVRTQQVERWQKELELQYRIASRLIEVQRQDLALMGGMT